MEGIYDTPVYTALLHKIHVAPLRIFSREAGGVAALMKTFPGLLQALEYVDAGEPVDRALVIRDTGGRDRESVERQMVARVDPRTYRFPEGVRLFAVRRAVETWLLADTDAIGRVAGRRRGRLVAALGGVLEEIEDPKVIFKQVLSRAGLSYTPAVCGEIAREIDLDVLRSRCASFSSFEELVLKP